MPTAAFGLIYGDFLKSIGDETTGTTLSNGIFTTVYSFTGSNCLKLRETRKKRFFFRPIGQWLAWSLLVPDCRAHWKHCLHPGGRWPDFLPDLAPVDHLLWADTRQVGDNF